MILVLNKCYGSFSISDFAMKELRISSKYPYRGEAMGLETRFHPDIAQLIDKYGSAKISGTMANLQIFEIPDDVSDWEIEEYDGFERLIYVEDGKLRYC